MKQTALIIGDPHIRVQQVAHKCEESHDALLTVNTDAPQVYACGVTLIAEIIENAGYVSRVMTIVGDDELSQQYKSQITASANLAYVETQPVCPSPAGTLTYVDDVPVVCREPVKVRATHSRRDTSMLLQSLYQIPADQLAEIGVVVLFDNGFGTCTNDVKHAIRQFSQLYSVPVIAAYGYTWESDAHHIAITTCKVAEANVKTAAHPGLMPGIDNLTRQHTLTQLCKQQTAANSVYVMDTASTVIYAEDTHPISYYVGTPVQQSPIDNRLELAAAAAAIAVLQQSSICQMIVDYVSMSQQRVGSYLPFADFIIARQARGNWAAKLLSHEAMLLYVRAIRVSQPNASVAIVIGLFDGIDHTDIQFLRQVKQQSDFVIVVYKQDAGVSTPCVVPESFRASHLAMLPVVDAVFGYAGDFEQLVRMLKPDVLADVDSAPGMKIPADDFVERAGGLVLTKPLSVYQ